MHPTEFQVDCVPPILDIGELFRGCSNRFERSNGDHLFLDPVRNTTHQNQS